MLVHCGLWHGIRIALQLLALNQVLCTRPSRMPDSTWIQIPIPPLSTDPTLNLTLALTLALTHIISLMLIPSLSPESVSSRLYTLVCYI